MKKIYQLVAIIATLVLTTSCEPKTETAPPLNPTTSNSKANVEHDTEFFADQMCTTLKSDVKNTDNFKSYAMQKLAGSILDGTYKTDYLCESYSAIQSASVLTEQYKLMSDGYSDYENITGVYITKGTHVIIVGPTNGRRLAVFLADHMRQPTNPSDPTNDPNGWGLARQGVALREGVNVFEAQKSTNAYISYVADDYKEAPQIEVHFVSGIANGYFDLERGDTNEDWDRLLANARSEIMDARSKHVHVAYPVSAFTKFTSGKGVELMQNYDRILDAEYEVMGLKKYGIVPPNRVFARVNFNYYMFRDSDGVAYLGDDGTMGMVATPERVIVGDPCWGFSHEVGHVMQMKPLTWGGMGEVSNNIFSLYASRAMGNSPSRLKSDYGMGGVDHYQTGRAAIVEKGIGYLAHDFTSSSDGMAKAGALMDRLVPLWQLQLYFEQNGNPDFYPDLMQYLRENSPEYSGNNTINYQLEFVKAACFVGKTNLLDFFGKWGFYKPGTYTLDDYGTYTMTITDEMSQDVIDYVVGLGHPEPSFDVTTLSE